MVGIDTDTNQLETTRWRISSASGNSEQRVVCMTRIRSG